MTASDTVPTSPTAAIPLPGTPGGQTARWAGVVALLVGVFVLVTSEFLPASLLPAMAAEFGVTEGVAGQVVTATALVGVVAGPATALVFPRLDRKRLLLGLLVLALAANLVTAIAPAFWMVVVARVALGLAISGTWSMALAVSAHLVPARHLGRAMMVVNTGVSAATVAAVPLGALISSVAGWRVVFFAVAGATAVAIVVMALAMPSVPAAAGTGLRALVATVRSRAMIVGLVGVLLIVAGHFASFTYIRPAAEQVPGLGATGIAALLAVYGVGGLLGNLITGSVVDKRLATTLVVLPTILGAAVIAFSFASGSVLLAFAAAAIWGMAFGGVPTMAQTWSARVEPERMESAGGLTVATFQLAISTGAVVGGVLIDATTVSVVFVAGGVSAALGGLLLASTRRWFGRRAA
ncbi:MFS transporter [Leifsonia sp. ZF2019]|uniref:MFS transporter n=1 Tax=Leifsonia sp. ZF2019 TaxID=2781978 RepID=UPI001CBD4E7A|nr:MFS transporter [Leifsonia sp. ZF2019]UAJ78483.1 MFS transporter [Leifsonia sp. ZF2019]